ncbi:hypothetical protein L1987_27520 [Smallanthus sonchifolius]|uniref:Uncharacterized protein n=1 Tax=Smallanthus sonchifolius TaxID=185202 RepID=A0ACB9ICA5_9ASTR|nr:hypothetical protein L1987_27520 [Smallanthus sonchifolius]
MTSSGQEEPKKLQLIPITGAPALSVFFLKLNPIGYVPALMDGDIVIADSFAIIMAANIVSASIQPLQNLDVLNFIEEKVGPDAKIPWVEKHIGKGFAGMFQLST